MAVNVTRRAQSAPYIGQKRHEKREGIGTYTYENKYFKYEGEWKNGKKHGKGKLLMKDGSYYEGDFYQGEINGFGFRYFSNTGFKYTGQFRNGEMHGTGKMVYLDGSTYDGQWWRNRKHGYGIMRTRDNTVYEGSYLGNLRHGFGNMTFSNGDKYSGNWENDKKHGKGELSYNDGSVYCGHFFEDFCHGEGTLKHCSGYVYSGQWRRGEPSYIASRLVVTIEKTPHVIHQGTPFSIRVECHTSDGQIVKDHGRELQIQAGFKYYPPREGSQLFDMIEDVEDKPIDTPFGYKVVPYPLTNKLEEKEDENGAVGEDEDDEKEDETTGNQTDGKTDEEGKDEDSNKEEDGEEANPEGTETEVKVEEGEETQPSPTEEATNGGEQTDGPEPPPSPRDPAGSEKDAYVLPPPVPNQKTADGACEWENLELPPAPPMYRPFVAMEEATGTIKKTTSKSKIDAPSRMSSRLAPTSSSVKKSFMLDKYRKEKKKLAETKYARTGEYVLMVFDVTNPPPLGRTLEPAFLLLKLKRAVTEKKTKEQGPRWNTSSHIRESMRRTISQEQS